MGVLSRLFKKPGKSAVTAFVAPADGDEEPAQVQVTAPEPIQAPPSPPKLRPSSPPKAATPPAENSAEQAVDSSPRSPAKVAGSGAAVGSGAVEDVAVPEPVVASAQLSPKAQAPASPSRGGEAQMNNSARSTPRSLEIVPSPTADKANNFAMAGPVVEEEPEAEQQQAGLDFHMPVDQLYSELSEAFGQMIGSSLQSAKWDKRSQALKAVSTVMKGLDLRAAPGSTGALGKSLVNEDYAVRWRLSCQLLNVSMRDKVMPVRLAAFELFLDTFTNVAGAVPQVELQTALGVLVEHIISTLGDSNLRLHESARRCIVFTAEHTGLLGLSAVLGRLRSRVEARPRTGKAGKSSDMVKTYFGVLDAVSVLVQQFPGKRTGAAAGSEEEEEDDEVNVTDMSQESWALQDVTPFISAGLTDDSLGPRVRNLAASLAVTCYQTFGMEAMKPLLASLRKPQQALLKQKFQESEMDEGDMDEGDDGGEMDDGRDIDLSGLVVTGNAVRASKHVGQQLPGLPGSVHHDHHDEEMMMDGILEEAGMVFGGTTTMGEALPSGTLRMTQGGFGATSMDGFGILNEEDRLLEEELFNMGLDSLESLEALEEQQALLRSYQDAEANRNDVSVEELLSSIVEDPRQRHEVSIEVF